MAQQRPGLAPLPVTEQPGQGRDVLGGEPTAGGELPLHGAKDGVAVTRGPPSSAAALTARSTPGAAVRST